MNDEQGHTENLHARAAAKAEDQVQGRFLLNVVVSQSLAILQLLASKDQALLVGRNALTVLNLLLDSLHSVRRLDIQSHGLARQSTDCTGNKHGECNTENNTENRKQKQ